MIAKIFLLVTLAISVRAYGYGSGGFGGGGFSSGGSSGGIAGSLAVHTRHNVRYIPTPSYGYTQPTNVEINSRSPPINLHFRSVSSPVNVQHVHIPSRGSFRETSSVDEPHIRIHTVTKPIIQELREIITPRRLITQQILPVQETVNLIVARATGGNGGFGGGFGGFGRRF